MTTTDYATTRGALHAIAADRLGADLQRSTGKIGLRPTVGGFGQPEHFVDGVRRRLRVDGTDLVVLDGDVERWEALEATIDPAHAARLHAAHAVGAAALERLRRAHVDLAPTIVQIWPEHFDVACSFAEINFGVSPGDDDHPTPYAYVGPWTVTANAFWNRAWGRLWPLEPATATAEVVAWFEEGLAAATNAGR